MSEVKYLVGGQQFSADDLVKIGAKSPDLFYQIFFPRTVRQKSAPFHLQMDAALEDASKRLVQLRMFRGSAKTSRLRMYTARRVAYGLARTTLYLGASEGHAIRSIRWIKSQVEKNKVFSSVFGLRPGSKWQESEIEIVSETTGLVTWILGAGITGNIRGINFDDYRPDTIILDDVLTDENAATEEQREKYVDLILGAVRGSLAPVADDPNAKLVMAQTPIALDDASDRAAKSAQWHTIDIPCWTAETLDAPLDEQVSAWPERIPSEELRAAKRDYIAENKLSVWNREYEVRITSKESASFRVEWLNIIDVMPQYTWNILAVDPLPPPSDREVAKGLVGKDYEAIGVIGHRNGAYFVREYVTNRGHEPNWTVAKIFELAARNRVFKIVVEGVAYQRVLKYLIELEMRRRGVWYTVEAVTDKRKKYNKIVGTLSGPASQGQLYCLEQHSELRQQFAEYPNCKHDDVLDMVALGLSRLVNPVLEMGADDYMEVIASQHGRISVPLLRSCP